MDDKERKITLVVMIVIFALVAVIVIGFSIYQNKKTEKVISKSFSGYSDELQEMADDYDKSTGEIRDEVQQKIDELNKK